MKTVNAKSSLLFYSPHFLGLLGPEDESTKFFRKFWHDLTVDMVLTPQFNLQKKRCFPLSFLLACSFGSVNAVYVQLFHRPFVLASSRWFCRTAEENNKVCYQFQANLTVVSSYGSFPVTTK